MTERINHFTGKPAPSVFERPRNSIYEDCGTQLVCDCSHCGATVRCPKCCEASAIEYERARCAFALARGKNDPLLRPARLRGSVCRRTTEGRELGMQYIQPTATPHTIMTAFGCLAWRILTECRDCGVTFQGHASSTCSMLVRFRDSGGFLREYGTTADWSDLLDERCPSLFCAFADRCVAHIQHLQRCSGEGGEP